MVTFFLKLFNFHAYIQLLAAKKKEADLKDYKKKLEERARDGDTDCLIPDEYAQVIISWAKKEGFKVKKSQFGYFVKWDEEESEAFKKENILH